MEKFNPRNLNDVVVKEQYQVKISNWFVTLAYVDDDVDMNRVWGSSRLQKLQPQSRLL
jgi:hypothetical protein